MPERQQVKQAMAPVDLNTAAITGARISMGNFNKVCVVLDMGGSAGATVEMTLKQHTAASGGSSKVLSTLKPHFVKAGAADVFTKVEPNAARSLVDLTSVFAATNGIAMIEIDAAELDVNGGYTFFSVDIADSGAAKIGSCQYHLLEPRKLPAYDVVTV